MDGTFGSDGPSRQPLSNQNLPLFIASPYGYLHLVPDVLRIPRALREQRRLAPKDCRRALKTMPAKWRAEENSTNTLKFKEAMQRCDSMIGAHADLRIIQCTMDVFKDWLRDRGHVHFRCIEDVNQNSSRLQKAWILPGKRWCDFLGDEAPDLPTTTYGEKWRLFLTDFVMDSYASVASFLHEQYFADPEGNVHVPQRIWMRYHGCNLFALSNLLATNYPIASDKEIAGAEMAEGRGVYTSRQFYKACQYGSGPKIVNGFLVVEVKTRPVTINSACVGFRGWGRMAWEPRWGPGARLGKYPFLGHSSNNTKHVRHGGSVFVLRCGLGAISV